MAYELDIPNSDQKAKVRNPWAVALLPIITLISVFVLFLLLYVMVKFNHRANPTPARWSHNTTVEIIWTVVPVLILMGISIFSFRLLYAYHDSPKSALTVKVTGNQWYWSYEYPDYGIAFDSNIVPEKDLKDGQPRLLTVDNPVVVPVGKVVRVQVTSADVIHDWAMPSMGVKQDTVPGRLNETWFQAEREGIYYGQCSFICGQDHAFMPIAIRVVSPERYAAWLNEAKQKFASAEDAGNKLAAATR